MEDPTTILSVARHQIKKTARKEIALERKEKFLEILLLGNIYVLY